MGKIKQIAKKIDLKNEKHLVVGVWFVIFLVWAFYRAYFSFPEWVDEMIVKPIVFVFPVVYILIIREKKKINELGFESKGISVAADFYTGVIIGILFALEGLVANYTKNGKFFFAPIASVLLSGGLIPFLILNFATSLWEEILGRGFLYQRLYKISGNQFWAASFSSCLFLLLHIPIMFTRLHLTGISFLVYPLSIFILSMTNAYLFSLRRSLTLPILLHLFWNMTVALYL
jgi:membrane protease YdiL (CAAX protease family)